MTKKRIIIFSGYNERAIIAFIRSLEIYNINYHIISNGKEDSILSTKYKSKVLYVRNSPELSALTFKQIILESRKKLNTDDVFTIMPSTEALNRFLLKNQLLLDKLNCEVPLVNEEMYSLISDKYSFGSLCKSYDINVPNVLELCDISKFPVVVKSRVYSTNSEAPAIIQNKNDLIKFFDVNNITDYYIQDYVHGDSHYLLAYLSKLNDVAYYISQENLVQQSNGKSMVAAKLSNFYEQSEAQKYIAMLKKIGFYGLIMIEVKINDSEIVMIEANPRFWGPSQLFIDANYNLFNPFLSELGFIDSTNLSYSELNMDAKYFWFGGYLKSLRKYNDIVIHNNKFFHFDKDFHKWLKSDVYLRDDTWKIFMKEVE